MDEEASSSSVQEIDELPCESLEELIAFNEAYQDVIDNAIATVNEKLRENREKQRFLREEQKRLRNADLSKKKVPVNLYMPPYFKDENGLCPPMNSEARRKLDSKWFDPLMKEEKKWTPAEIKTLRAGIKDAMINISLQSLTSKRDLLTSKLKSVDATTTQCERYKWTMDLEEIMRKIEYGRNRTEEEVLLPTEDYTSIPWNEIANVTMKGTRTEWAVRAKWLNELSPKWNKSPWKNEEIEKMRDLRESPKFVSWTMLALQLGTNRSAFQCLEKFKSEVATHTKEWTSDEDKKLIALTKMATINGNISWDKVAQFMPGRSRLQVRTRYTHTLDINIKHGRWTDQEDMLLISAVSRIGAKDWAKVSNAVPGRNEAQCRERWANVLNKPTHVCERFTLAEDEQLLYAVKLFGKGNWAKCSTLLPQKTPRQLRKRYIQLIAAKLKMVAGVCNAVEAMESARRDDQDESSSMAEPQANSKLAKAFESMSEFDQQCLLETPDELLKRVNNGAQSVTARYKKFRESPNWPIIERNLQEICEKHQCVQDVEIRSNEVLKMLSITDVDVRYMVQQNKNMQKLRNARNWKAQVDHGGGRVRPVSNFKHDNSVMTIFNPDVPESERQMSLVEALCMVVRKHDSLIWGKTFWTSFQYSAHKSVAAFVQSMLNERSLDVANYTKEKIDSMMPAKTTMAPNTTSLRMLEMVERARAGLNRIAVQSFYPIDVGVEQQKVFDEGEREKEVNRETQLNISLSEEVKQSSQFHLFAARMRAILFEPYRLKIAIESVEQEEQRFQNELLLEDRLTEEEKASPQLDNDKPLSRDVAGDLQIILDNGIDVETADLVNPTDMQMVGRKRVADTMEEIWENVMKRSQETPIDELYMETMYSVNVTDEQEEQPDQVQYEVTIGDEDEFQEEYS